MKTILLLIVAALGLGPVPPALAGSPARPDIAHVHALIASLHERDAGPEGQAYRKEQRRRKSHNSVAAQIRRARSRALVYSLSAQRRHERRVGRILRKHGLD